MQAVSFPVPKFFFGIVSLLRRRDYILLRSPISQIDDTAVIGAEGHIGIIELNLFLADRTQNGFLHLVDHGSLGYNASEEILENAAEVVATGRMTNGFSTNRCAETLDSAGSHTAPTKS